MLSKTKETKVIRDAIHNYIHVDYQIIWDCINTREFQRLRRIHQLGATYQVYPTAEHSRFSHSLGVYEIVRRMLNEVEDINLYLNEEEAVLIMLVALLHDVGHGPFSHAFEVVSGMAHEEMTKQIVRSDSEVARVLQKYDKGLPAKIIQVLDNTHPNKLLSQLISGQLDADRMDYLLRDAYFTGTRYGDYDFERVLKTMKVKDQKLLVKENGVHAVEDYIMARYHMYWQVYYHPVSRSFEAMVGLFFKRMKAVYQSNPECFEEARMFIAYLQESKVDNEAHYILDESSFQYGFHILSHGQDKVLRDLGRRLLSRDLFEYTDELETKQEILDKLAKAAYDSEYYYYEDQVRQKVYEPYYSKGTPIWILKRNNEIVELSAVSSIVEAINKSEEKIDDKIYFPKEIL